VGTWELLAQRLGWERVAGSVVSTGMQMPAPGEVEVTVQGFPWRIGLPREFAGPAAPGLEALAQAAAASPVPFEWSPNIEAAAWRKLVYNNALNALATLRGGSYDLLWGDREVAATQDHLIDELWAVGLAHGVQFEPWTLDAMKAWFWPLFERTRFHEPSMLVHLRRGRRTEIDALNGAISRLGRRHGVPTPENDSLRDAIHALERATLPNPEGPLTDA
jgi:2-dehydropantoate 2-reductase